MKNNNKLHFTVFRYQLLPIDNQFQPDLIGSVKTVEDLVEIKNQIFAESLLQLGSHYHRGKKLTIRFIYNKNDLILFKLGIQKESFLENEKLERVKHKHWPSILVAIDNKNYNQTISISQNTLAFSDSKVVKEVLSGAINSYLLKRNLKFIKRDLFNETDFWNIISENNGKILYLKFELTSPNMANISSKLKLDLKSLKSQNNVQNTEIKISADPHSSLTVKKTDTVIPSLIEYSSKGGGAISAKIRGLKKVIKTGSTEKEIIIDELELENLPEDSIETIIKNVTNV
ncbi:hypothetical protein NUH30_19165 [Leptospira sp. 85282-16]|uniref:hypothetical protein n=1 Tax=Leptospira sp. 85282-16 TaxID=2971256 RepID=UPI0021C16428|nr:hypothetical protein [Leptospira sp. 85282-16]MCT8335815.1 hypothetical protein [Leptospira sp. 85282-16]